VSLNRCALAGGHRVVVEREFAELACTVEREDPSLVIIDATSAPTDLQHTIEALRSHPHYRFVTVLGTGGPSESLSALQAGADDYLRFPFEPNEFMARLGAIERLMGHLLGTRTSMGEGPSLVGGLQAWQNLEATVTETVGEMLCAAVQRVMTPVPHGRHLISRLRLSLPRPRASVTLHMVAPQSALQSMAGLLLGSPSSEQEVLVDISKEVLNTVAGAFKREALPDYDFACSVPEEVTQNALQHAVETAAFTKSWNVGWSQHVVGIVVCVAREEVVTLPLHSLAEGMILADDVRNPVGMLIAPRGTPLTETAIRRLHSVFGGTATLRVSNAV
jgi:CheY-like chemotaxis protein